MEASPAQLIEFFNGFNHPVFNAPNLTPTSTAFGTISGVYNLERHIQMALRMTAPTPTIP